MAQGGPGRPAAQDLIDRCRALAAAGLVTAAAGNASVRVGSGMLITATGARFADLTTADLVAVDETGAAVGADPRPSSELQLHLQVYARRPDVGAVMHSHGRHAVALSTLVDVVPALHYYCVDLGGPVPVAPYRTFGTHELAEVTAETLGDGNAVVMAHHGSLTVGPSPASASARAELVEWLCEVALLAMAAGTPAELDAERLDAVRDQIAARRWP